jgi:hypothetical protein
MPKPVFRRPWLHHLIIVGYIAAPFANILLLRLFLSIPLRTILSSLSAGYGVLATVWLVTAPIVGIALYFVSSFSWYLFLGHSSLVLIDFVLKWVSRPSHYLRSIPGTQNLLILAGNLALVVLVAFIIRRDFRAPYFQAISRGWRQRRRCTVRLPVDLEGEVLIASDLSESGCFIVDGHADRVPGARVRLALPLDASRIECAGQIMRSSDSGLGIRFLGLTPVQKREIGRLARKGC